MTPLNVKILAEGRLVERRLEVESDLTYEDLFDILELNPETVVALKGGLPVPADDIVEAGEVRIIRTVSSG